jgi:glycosyltransferase involved in cell wall biosynthesis
MKIAILHYTAPPVVGGVEAVMHAHTDLFCQAGFQVSIIAGKGDQAALPAGARLVYIPEMYSLHPGVIGVSQQLEAGRVPDNFEGLSSSLEFSLRPALESIDTVIIHNVFTKHFNLPLTAALIRLLDGGTIRNAIAWCHDFTWTSPYSQVRVHPGYPWDLLRTYRQDVVYVTVSKHRQTELAGLLQCPMEKIHVIYNGIDPADIFSLSEQGKLLVQRMELDRADLILLMPVRITQAKNIELALQVIRELKNRGLKPRLMITGPPDPHDPATLQYYHSLLELRQQLQIQQEACFIYEMGLTPGEGYTIGLPLLRELFRVSDILFVPSHREGFGMPILEAGMTGLPIFTTTIPAAEEIGKDDVFRFNASDPADKVAEMLQNWTKSSSTQALRQRVRQKYSWQAIYQLDILPLLNRKEAK